MSDGFGGERHATGEVALLMVTHSDVEAEMVRQLLASYGIPTQVVSDVPHTVLPVSIDGLGEVRIFVPAVLQDEAKRLLAEHRRQGLEVVPGGAAGDDDTEDPSGEGSGAA